VVSEQNVSGGSGIVSRLNPDGSLDDSFLSGTYTATLQGDGWGATYSIVPEVSGDLLIKGDIAVVNGIPAPRLARLLVNGGSPPVTIDPASVQVLETNGLVNITLVRTGNTSDAYTVNWATEGGTALPGVDFVAGSGTITFAPNQSDQSISLQLLDNQTLESDRTVRLRLTTLDGTVLPSVTFFILNDDLGFVPGGSYAFPSGRFLINPTGYRNGGTVQVERSTDLRTWEYWRDWITTPNSKIIDYETPTASGTRWFYRLVAY
jgi:hypothetical protein